MRYIFAGVAILVVMSIGFAQGPAVTTAPAESEVEQLRTQIALLQSENQMLRAQLASLSVATSLPAGAKATMGPDDKPLNGVEGILDGIPHDQIPGRGDPEGGLRHTLMAKWVKEHAIGRMITLRARFGDTSGISSGHFMVRVRSHEMSHPFEATVVLPESDASTALTFHSGSGVRVTGRVKNADVTRTDRGVFVVLLDLDMATLSPP